MAHILHLSVPLSGTDPMLLLLVAQLFCVPDVQDVSLHHMDLSNVPDAQQLTALTASSQLEQLVITQPGRRNSLIRYNNSPLPRRALKHMFSSPKQWPSLQASWGAGVLLVDFFMMGLLSPPFAIHTCVLRCGCQAA